MSPKWGSGPAGDAEALLEPFIGHWDTEAKLCAAPEDAPPSIAADSYEWVPGGHFVLHHWDVNLPGGRGQGIEIIGATDTPGIFFMHAYDSDGLVSEMKAHHHGDEWRYDSESLRFAGRFSEGGAVYSGLWEERIDGEWVPWMDVTLRRWSEA